MEVAAYSLPLALSLSEGWECRSIVCAVLSLFHFLLLAIIFFSIYHVSSSEQNGTGTAASPLLVEGEGDDSAVDDPRDSEERELQEKVNSEVRCGVDFHIFFKPPFASPAILVGHNV